MSLNAHRTLFFGTLIITLIGLRPYYNTEVQETMLYTALYVLGGLGLCATIALSKRWRSMTSLWVGLCVFVLSIVIALPWRDQISNGGHHWAFAVTWVGGALSIGMVTAGAYVLDSKYNGNNDANI